MGKVVKTVAGVVGVAAFLIPGVGTAIGGAINSLVYGTSLGFATAFAGYAAGSIGSSVVLGLSALGLSTAVGFASKALGFGPRPVRQSEAGTDRLSCSIEWRG